jgi:hypothetical protein
MSESKEIGKLKARPSYPSPSITAHTVTITPPPIRGLALPFPSFSPPRGTATPSFPLYKCTRTTLSPLASSPHPQPTVPPTSIASHYQCLQHPHVIVKAAGPVVSYISRRWLLLAEEEEGNDLAFSRDSINLEWLGGPKQPGTDQASGPEELVWKGWGSL